MAKRLMCVILSVMLVVAMMPTGVVADSTDFSGYEEITSTGGALTSGSYYLKEDVKLDDDLTIAYGETVILDLNGHTLTGTGTSSVIYVEGSLTLNDSGSTGAITGGVGTSGRFSYGTIGGGVYVYSSGADYPATFEMNGGTISGNTATYRGAGVAVYSFDEDTTNSATFIMNGGAISSNTITGANGRANGAGVFVYDGVMTLNAGTISNNVATGSSQAYGGGVYIRQSSFTMTGGYIISNKSTCTTKYSYGGGVYVYSNEANIPATFIMTGGEISGNTATGTTAYGGGVSVESSVYCYATFTMRGGIISNNNANGTYNGYGGGVYVCYSSFTLSNGSIYGNTVSGTYAGIGGGVCVYGNNGSGTSYHSSLTMTGGTISNNTAGIGGGVGLFVYTATNGSSSASFFYLQGGTVTGNTATESGGGVSVDTQCELEMTSGAVYGNEATSSAADAYMDLGSKATLIDASSMTADGASFTGYAWYKDESGNRFDSSTNVTDTVDVSETLTGSLSLIAATLTLTYDDNVDSEDITVPEAQNGTELTISSTVPTRTGYTFAGWNTASNGSGDSYSAGDSITISADTTLYAQWTAITSYVKAYDVNLGSSLAIGFYLPAENFDLTSGTYTVTLTQTYGSDYSESGIEAGDTRPVTYTLNDESTTYYNGVECYFLVLDGINAKELTDAISIEIQKDGVTIYAPSGTTSIAKFERSYINKNSSDEDAVALAKALLTYGAAAQTYFKYNTSDLATAYIPE